MKKSICTLPFLALSFSACSDSSKPTATTVPPAPSPTPGSLDPAGSSAGEPSNRIASGKYFLTAGRLEGFDNLGNKLDPQTLQITGEYTWTVSSVGKEKYEITGTGSAKINNSNQILAEVNCIGAQDVFVFELNESNQMRGLKITETGCPKGVTFTAAQQHSLEPLNDKTFVYNIAYQANGYRFIESYTFKK